MPRAFCDAPFKACIFDLDGTLVDSEPGYYASDLEFFAPWGIVIDEELNLRVMGTGTKAYMGLLAELFPDNPFCSLPLEERVRLRDGYYLEHWAPRARPFPAMAGLVSALRARGLPLGLASGSSRAAIGATLGSAGLSRDFSVILSCEELARGKPFPDIYLEAARRLGAAPADCLVFEDGAKGLAAAKAAGMACVALPDPGMGPPYGEAFSTADLIVAGGPGAVGADYLLGLVDGLGARRAKKERRDGKPPSRLS